MMQPGRLADLQRSFASFITHSEDMGQSRVALDSRSDFALFDHVRADRDVSAGDRLWIYEHAYFARIHEVLQEDFGAAKAAVGADAFHDLAKLYLMAHPPCSFSLRFAGEKFPGFLAGPVVEPLIGRWPFVADLAALEWTLVDLFDAPDDRLLERSALGRIAAERWGELRFALVRAAQLLRLDWPVHGLHEVWSEGSVGGASEAQMLPPIAPVPTAILVHRRRERVVYRAVGRLEELALSLLCGGVDFQTLCGSVSTEVGESEGPPFVLALLERWIGEELLAAFEDQDEHR